MTEQKESLDRKKPPVCAFRSFYRPKALVLAAGFSSRMGRCKALLDLKGLSALERTVKSLREGGIEEIVVVTGHYRNEVEQETFRLRCRAAFNESYERGMFSSIRRGIEALDNASAFLLLPVDVPLVSPATIRTLLEAHEKGVDLAYPTFLGRRGHPPLVGRRFFKAILDGDGSRGGLRVLLAEREQEALDVAVADEAILLDMDSPEDYKRLLERIRPGAIPSEAECHALWDLASTSEGARRHGETVAAVADRLASALGGTSGLDRERLHRASLLHDLARGGSRHAEEGARFLIRWGFDALAPLVESHMKGPEGDDLDEAALLFAADKIVESSSLVTLEARRETAARRFADNPEALEGALLRLDKAEAILLAVERQSGRELATILEGLP